MKLAIILFNLLFSIFVLAGGSLVGNGSGVSEQNIIFAYSALIDSIDQCISGPNCGLTDLELTQLQKIRAVRLANASRSNVIQFVSESQSPEFFELSVIEQHRIAKTGLTSDSPIYFNSDVLYLSDGVAEIDFPLATAILIHEVGHQAGNPDHAFLDGIGAKIRYALTSKQVTYNLSVDSDRNSIQIFNYGSLTIRSQAFLTTSKAKVSLGHRIGGALNCSSPDARIAGFEVWNGHWESAGQSGYRFTAWVRFSCLSAGQLQIQRADLGMNFNLNSEGDLELLDVGTKEAANP